MKYTIEEIKNYMEGFRYSGGEGEHVPDNEALNDAIENLDSPQYGIEKDRRLAERSKINNTQN